MLNKKSIKTILNVKHTAIEKVTMLADTSIHIQVQPTKGEVCRCGICRKKSPYYNEGRGFKQWRTYNWAGHRVMLYGPTCRVKRKGHSKTIFSKFFKALTPTQREVSSLSPEMVINGSTNASLNTAPMLNVA